jgi:hypothetical protein
MAIRNLNDLLVQTTLPGLRRPDTLIAQAWLREHGKEYDSVEFNVRLGQGIVLPPGSDPSLVLFAQSVTTKKADLVAHSNSDVAIVEVKIRVTPDALGQLVVYRRLYKDQYPNVGKITLIVAAQYLTPDVADTYEENGILIETFPAALPVSL